MVDGANLFHSLRAEAQALNDQRRRGGLATPRGGKTTAPCGNGKTATDISSLPPTPRCRGHDKGIGSGTPSNIPLLQLEAAVLSRAHRSLSPRAIGSPVYDTEGGGGGDCIGSPAAWRRSSWTPPPASPRRAVSRHSVCPLCGHEIDSSPKADVQVSQVSPEKEHLLSSRLDVAETLLARAMPDAAVASSARAELEEERLRTAELKEAMAEWWRLAEQLRAALDIQTKEFAAFVNAVRNIGSVIMPPLAGHNAVSVVRHGMAVVKEREESLAAEQCVLEQLIQTRGEEFRGPILQECEEDVRNAMMLLGTRLSSEEFYLRSYELDASKRFCHLEEHSRSQEFEHSKFADIARLELEYVQHRIRQVEECEGNVETALASRTSQLEQTESECARRIDDATMAQCRLRRRTQLVPPEMNSGDILAIRTLMSGVALEKWSVKHKRWNPRTLIFFQSAPGKALSSDLRWGACKGYRATSSTTRLPLKDIVRIDVGDTIPTRMVVDQTHGIWCQFVVWSHERPYSFQTETIQAAEDCIVGIAHVAAGVQAVTRRELLLRRARWKLGSTRAARATALLDAARRAAADMEKKDPVDRTAGLGATCTVDSNDVTSAAE